MQDCLQDDSSCFQYADDTMVLHHPTPKDFDVDGYTPPLTLKDKTVDRVEKFKLLGTWLSEDIKWTEHANEVTSSCYKVLATLRKIKNMTPQETEKSLVQSLELSKLNFNYYVTYSLPTFLEKKTTTHIRVLLLVLSWIVSVQKGTSLSLAGYLH